MQSHPVFILEGKKKKKKMFNNFEDWSSVYRIIKGLEGSPELFN